MSELAAASSAGEIAPTTARDPLIDLERARGLVIKTPELARDLNGSDFRHIGVLP